MNKVQEAQVWFNLLDYLQREPTSFWSEEVFKVFNLIQRYQPEKIFGKIIEGTPIITIIHSTKRGPALGGTRILLYRNIVNALRDCLKLAAAMTFKAIWARLALGGGKAVIYASPREITKSFLREYAEFLNEINRDSPTTKFITGEDIGFSEEFTDVVAQYSPYISGKSIGAGGLGDPSPHTAEGIFLATKEIIRKGEIFSGTLENKIVAIQGAGKVALPLIEMLLGAGAIVYFSEIDEERAKIAEALGAKRVDKDQIYSTPCHIFMPCAIGGVINKSTIPALSPMCRIVIGAANNILDTPEDGIELHKRRIFYAPDYVVNRWGLEWVNQESQGITDLKIARENLTDIKTDIVKIIDISRRKNIAPSEIADLISKKILEEEAKSIEEAFSQL